MECKFIYDSISLWIFRELIDTLWNVNLYDQVLAKKTNVELIDTLWNVNRD